MKKTIRLTESELKHMIMESVNEYYNTNEHWGALTVGELISELQKMDSNATIEVYTGNVCHNVTNVENGMLFLDALEYEKWKKAEEDAANHPQPRRRGMDYGEDFS